MIGNTSKNVELMIVCNDKFITYANYIMGLIGEKNKINSEIDGEESIYVSAAIYTEKAYRDTLQKIGSGTHVLFIGDSKESKEQKRNIEMKFNQFGMHYGWLGKRAVMCVDRKRLTNCEYEEFIDFSDKYENKFNNVRENWVEKLPWLSKGNVLTAGAAAVVVSRFVPVFIPIVGVAGAVSYNKDKKVRDQQYRCMTLAFYLDDLQNFLGA